MRFIKIYCVILVLLGLQSCRKASTSHERSRSRVERTNEQNNAQRNQKSTFIQNEDKVEIRPSDNMEFDGTTIFKKYNSAVFMIFTSDGINKYQGSGFFINNKGLAVSNYHIFEGTSIGAEQIKLVNNINVYKVTEIITKSKENDFIIFKVNVPKSNYISLAKEKPVVGEKVYTIGSPLGLENTFSSGEISQIRDSDFIQISCPIDHGSSGGVLLNRFGEAIGITTAIIDKTGANLNFAKNIHVLPKQYLQ